MQNGNTVKNSQQYNQYGPIVPQKTSAFASLLGGSYNSPSTTNQTSTSPIGTGGSYVNPGGIVGSISNFGKGIASSVQNPSSGYGMFQGLFPQTANAQTNSSQTSYPSSAYSNVPGSPQAAALQQQADLNQYFPGLYQGTSNTPVSTPQSTPVNPTAQPSIWNQAINSLGGVQAPSATTGAISTLQGVASGQPAYGSTNLNSLYGAQGTLGNIASAQTPQVNSAYQNLQNFNQTNPLLKATQAALPMAAEVSTGRGSILGNVLAGEQQGLANTYNAAIQGQGQQIQAAGEQGGLANTGIQNQAAAAQNAGNLGLGAQQQQIEAAQGLLGTPGGALATYGTGGNNLNPQSTASDLAQQVVSGKMSYQDAVNSLGYAGAVGQQFLNSAIQQISPGFNTQQAQSNTQTQGTLNPLANQANTDLNILQNNLQSLPGWANTGIPAVNAITRWIGDQLGNQSTQTINDDEGAAQAAIQTLLQSGYSMTPTDAGQLIKQWFPSGATPQQIQTGVQQFNSFVQARQQAFGSPGTTQYNPGQSPQFSGAAWQ